MYLHIGNGKTIKTKDIVGIFDSDTATVSRITRSWLSSAERRGVLSSASGEIPKSIVLECGKKGERLFFAAFSENALPESRKILKFQSERKRL